MKNKMKVLNNQLNQINADKTNAEKISNQSQDELKKMLNQTKRENNQLLQKVKQCQYEMSMMTSSLNETKKINDMNEMNYYKKEQASINDIKQLKKELYEQKSQLELLST